MEDVKRKYVHKFPSAPATDLAEFTSALAAPAADAADPEVSKADPVEVRKQWGTFISALGLPTAEVPEGADATVVLGGRVIHLIVAMEYPFKDEDAARAQQLCEQQKADVALVYGAPKQPAFDINDETIFLTGAVSWLYRPSAHLNHKMPADFDLSVLPKTFQMPTVHAFHEDYWGKVTLQPLYAGEPLPMKHKKEYQRASVALGYNGQLAGVNYRGFGRSPSGPKLRKAYGAVITATGGDATVKRPSLAELLRQQGTQTAGNGDMEVTFEPANHAEGHAHEHVHGPDCDHSHG